MDLAEIVQYVIMNIPCNFQQDPPSQTPSRSI